MHNNIALTTKALRPATNEALPREFFRLVSVCQRSLRVFKRRLPHLPGSRVVPSF
jgi:hypothetical protein